MSSKHVEVLRHMKETIRAIMPSEVAALDAAIASLSAPQPPAEAQPVAWLGANPRTGVPVMAVRTPTPSVMRDFAMRPLYANPPPSAPVRVEDESVRVGNLPTMNQDGYQGLGEWWVQLWRGDEIIARVYGDGPDEVRSQAQDIADALNQQPAAVDGAMVKAAQEQISEGIGAYLRKFTDSEAAKHAREHLHQMPASEWSGMTRMLAEEAVGAALAAQQGGES